MTQRGHGPQVRWGAFAHVARPLRSASGPEGKSGPPLEGSEPLGPGRSFELALPSAASVVEPTHVPSSERIVEDLHLVDQPLEIRADLEIVCGVH